MPEESAESASGLYHEMPEPPHHELQITGDDGVALRYVNSDHPDVWDGVAHRKHQIVRCGICGHDSTGWGITAGQEVWMDHDYHFHSHHVGVKVVWLLEDVHNRTLAEVSEMTRRRFLLDDDDPEYVHAYRGDTPDEKVRELVDTDEPVVVVHQPPREPYPGSVEADATEGIYVA